MPGCGARDRGADPAEKSASPGASAGALPEGRRRPCAGGTKYTAGAGRPGLGRVLAGNLSDDSSAAPSPAVVPEGPGPAPAAAAPTVGAPAPVPPPPRRHARWL